jgi:uncharacterized protein YdhG (YjbR/CyaY superfamily)
MPTFSLNKDLVHFAVHKKHIGFHIGIEGINYFSERLKEYKTTKSTIQFPLDKTVDYELIAEITKWRVCNFE